MKITPLDRILLLLVSLLSAWQVAVGINDADMVPMIAYTVGFGTLVVAGLLLIILGWEGLESPYVIIIASLIPASLSLGLAWEFLPTIRTFYLGFVLAGFLAILITRLSGTAGRSAVFTLILFHGVQGLMIFLLPIIMVISDMAAGNFWLVGIGGALSGLSGLLLTLMRSNNPILDKPQILRILPGLMLASTAALVVGFSSI
ncbi:hypothetical protein ACFLTX_03005 [Chloroflexota bacterium]